jgi:TRAP-type mannitol/chloroaromatic compound transport system permease small subunit
LPDIAYRDKKVVDVFVLRFSWLVPASRILSVHQQDILKIPCVAGELALNSGSKARFHLHLVVLLFF